MCTCLDTYFVAQVRSVFMCRRLYNVCRCLETSVCAPLKSMCMSRRLCNVFDCSKMTVYADLSTVCMLCGLFNTRPSYEVPVSILPRSMSIHRVMCEVSLP